MGAHMWPLWLSVILFVAAYAFLVIGEVRNGRFFLSKPLPDSLRHQIGRLAGSSWWRSLVKQEAEDDGDEYIGECGTGTLSRFVKSEAGDLAAEHDEVKEKKNESPPVRKMAMPPDATIPATGTLEDFHITEELEDSGNGGGVTHAMLQKLLLAKAQKRRVFVARSVLTTPSHARADTEKEEAKAAAAAAWEWDLWEHSKRWPIMEHVLALPRTTSGGGGGGDVTTSPSGHVFVTEEPSPSLLSFQAPLARQRPASSRASPVREMLTLDFLSQNTLVSSGSGDGGGLFTSYYYRCNYRVYEGIVGGGREANLLNPNLPSSSPSSPFSWRSFGFNELDMNTTSALQQRGVDLSAAALGASMWILPTGAALQLRYAETHVSRVQLAGTGTYYLFPPSALPYLSLFPTGHTARGQSQIPMYEPDRGARADAFPAMSKWLDHQEQQHGGNYNPPGGNNNPQQQQQQNEKEKEKDRKVGRGGVVKVTLRPGDVMYVPPYWGVHSEASHTDKAGAAAGAGERDSSFSVVLDVPSVSMEQLALLEAWHMRLPMLEPALYNSSKDATKSGDNEKKEKEEEGEGDGGQSQSTVIEVSQVERVVAAKVFLVHVLSRVPSLHRSVSSPRVFAAQLYNSRYKALYAPGSLFMRPYTSFLSAATGGGGDDDGGNQGQHQYGGEGVFQCFKDSPEQREEVAAAVARLNADHLTNRADFVAACVEDAAVPLGVKRVWLEDYAERVAAWAMGSSSMDFENQHTTPSNSNSNSNSNNRHEEGLRFLLSCLDQPQYVPVTVEEEVLGDGSITLDAQ